MSSTLTPTARPIDTSCFQMIDKLPMVIKDQFGQIIFCNDLAIHEILNNDPRCDEVMQKLAVSATDLQYHETVLSYVRSSYDKTLRTDMLVKLTKAPLINKVRLKIFDEDINLVVTKRMLLGRENQIVSTFYRLSKHPLTMENNKILISDYFYPVAVPKIQYMCLVYKTLGLTNAQVAKRVYRTESHMRTITQELFKLFDVHDYFTLTRYAQLSGWIDNKIIKEIF